MKKLSNSNLQRERIFQNKQLFLTKKHGKPSCFSLAETRNQNVYFSFGLGLSKNSLQLSSKSLANVQIQTYKFYILHKTF